MSLLKRLPTLAPLIPYFAVAVGLFGFRSAWAALGIYHAGMLAFFMYSRHHGANLSTRPVRLTLLLPATLIFAVGGVLLYVLWPYLGKDGDTIPSRLMEYGINHANWPFFAVYFVVVNSILEELFWRGSLGTDVTRPTANDFFFGGYHVLVLLAFAYPVWALPVFAATAFAGWLWRMLKRLDGSLTIPLVTHVVADVSIVVAVYMRAFS